MSPDLFDDLKPTYPDGLLLLDSVIPVAADNGGIDFVGRSPFRVAGLQADDLDLVRRLRAGLSWADLSAAALNPRARQLLRELCRRRMLVNSGVSATAAAAGPLERQIYWLSHVAPSVESAQELLRRQHVIVVGCGGTGAIVVQHLGAMGIGTLTLIDFDTVAQSNLNRQFPFRRSDIGRLKTSALRDHVLERHPDCDVRTVNCKVQSPDDLTDRIALPAATALFCCADQPVGQINAIVCAAAIRLQIPCMFGNVGLQDGTVGPLLTNPVVMQRYHDAMLARGAAAARALGSPIMKASLAPVNTVISACMASEWVAHLLGTGQPRTLNRTIVFDVATLQSTVERDWTVATSEDRT